MNELFNCKQQNLATHPDSREDKLVYKVLEVFAADRLLIKTFKGRLEE